VSLALWLWLLIFFDVISQSGHALPLQKSVTPLARREKSISHHLFDWRHCKIPALQVNSKAQHLGTIAHVP
jgi:hypothetical protein